MIKKTAFGLAFLALSASAALAGGLWDNFPTVGAPATSCGSVNGVTSCTTPAGPPSLTGAETIPADTNLSQGRNPQTAQIPIVTLGGGALQVETPLTGASITVSQGVARLMLVPAGTIATLTVTLPVVAQLTDGQVLMVGSSATVTALTLTAGAGTSIVGAPTTVGATSGFTLVYRASNTSWYRIQ